MKTRDNGYYCWRGMKQRCYDSNHKDYHNYGGIGVIVCERWLKSFEYFIEDMGLRPSLKHSISRYGDIGNYEPNNCEWSISNFKPHTAKHGTCSKYASGCRCASCTEINKQYQNSLRRAAGIPIRQKAQHGTKSKYGRGCRCNECREANRIYHQQYRQRKRV